MQKSGSPGAEPAQSLLAGSAYEQHLLHAAAAAAGSVRQIEVAFAASLHSAESTEPMLQIVLAFVPGLTLAELSGAGMHADCVVVLHLQPAEDAEQKLQAGLVSVLDLQPAVVAVESLLAGCEAAGYCFQADSAKQEQQADCAAVQHPLQAAVAVVQAGCWGWYPQQSSELVFEEGLTQTSFRPFDGRLKLLAGGIRVGLRAVRR